MLRRYRALFTTWLSDYGRSNGWIIERSGHMIGKLVDAEYAEMFWDHYRVEEISRDPSCPSVLADEFWTEFDFEHIQFRSIATGDLVENAIPARHRPDDDGRVMIRGLYIPVRNPSFLESGILMLLKMTLKSLNLWFFRLIPMLLRFYLCLMKSLLKMMKL